MLYEFTCQKCGKTFTRPHHQREINKYCSTACYWTRVVRPGIFREDGTVLVPLPSGEPAVIDAEDAELVLQYNWFGSQGYVKSCINGRTKSMHRLIMGEPPAPGMEVDHIDHNPRNNRRSNLRWANRTQQQGNTVKSNKTSGFRGVHRNRGGGWAARIHANGKTRHLGMFKTPEEAAMAYDAAAVNYFGEFAITNFPGDPKDA